MGLKELNERRRRALIEDIYKYDFRPRGYIRSSRRYPADGKRITIAKEGLIEVCFDLEAASDYKEDAYRWCHVDFFITTPNIDLPDSLKSTFTRVMNSNRKKLYWKHRAFIRIMDMDRAAEHIDKTVEELKSLLKNHSVIPKET